MSQGDVSITITGNVIADSELRYTQSGTPVLSFRVASNRRTYDRQKNQWVDADPLFMMCDAWNDLAVNATETLHKGMRVIVTGVLRQKNYEDNYGNRRQTVVLNVSDVGPSLMFAKANVQRVQRNQTAGGGFVQNTGGFSGNSGGVTQDEQPPF